MRLSLRFIIPLFLALGALAYAVVPLVDKLALQWFERDLDLRATLIASTVQEPLRDLIRAGNRTRLLQFFTRISQDERLYAVGFCPMGLGEPIATPTLPAEIRRARRDSGAGARHELRGAAQRRDPQIPLLFLRRPRGHRRPHHGRHRPAELARLGPRSPRAVRGEGLVRPSDGREVREIPEL